MSAKSAVSATKPLQRYSGTALAVLTKRRMAEFAASAERNPAWLTADTLRTFERALRQAIGRRVTANKPETMRRHDAHVFYATANRDAFKAVLLDTEPSVVLQTRTRRPPGVAQKLATYRMLLKYAERELPQRVLAYEEASYAEFEQRRLYMRTWAALGEQRQAVEIARAKARLTRGANARAPRSMLPALAELKAAARQQLHHLRNLQDITRRARAALARKRARVAELRARCGELEKY